MSGQVTSGAVSDPSRTLSVTRIADRFWYWQAINPDTPEAGWPNGSGPVVGSVFLEVDDGIVLIDPQVPPDAPNRDRFWAALDRDMARHDGKWLAILLTFPGHDRSTHEIVARYRAVVTTSIWIPSGTASWSPIGHTHVYHRETTLPGGIVPILFDFPGGYPDGEGAFFIPGHRALVLGDIVVGRESGDPHGPGLRLPPESTYIGEDDASRSAVRAWFGTTLLESLVDVQSRLDPQTILVTHGEPMIGTGGAAISELLGALRGYRMGP